MNFDSTRGISICITSWNSADYLKLCLDAIYHHTQLPYEVLVHDNASEDNTEEVVATTNAENVKYTRGENRGINAGWNWCIENAKYEYIYTPHTDHVVLPNWDIGLAEMTKKIPVAWKFLGCSRSLEKRSHIQCQATGYEYGKINNFDIEKLLADAEKLLENKIVTAPRQPFFFHRMFFDKLGGFDCNFYSFAEDDDKVLAAWDLGIRRFPMTFSSLVYHFGGATNSRQNIDRDLEKPYFYLYDKYKTTHPNMMKGEKHVWPYIVNLINYYSKIV